MPKKPLKICAKPGCTAKTIERYCEKHKKARWSEYDKTRESSTKRGYDYKWRKFRDSFLRINSLCVMCLESGKVVQGSEVDHIKSLKEYPELKYHADNCRTLCKSCHSKRTYEEQGLGRYAEKESDSIKASQWDF